MSGPSLYVDLDGTLVRSDLFAETLISSVKSDPLNSLRIPVWLMRGIPIAKAMAARRGSISVEHLPYDMELVAYLHEQRQRGRRIYLATACHFSLAHRVARHLGIFDGVIATRGGENVKGAAKLARILDREAAGSFSYAGDSASDAPLWRAAASGVFVRAPARQVSQAQAEGKVERVFALQGHPVSAFVRALRPHQWAKNLLLFLPLFAAHKYGDAASVVAALLAFLCFCLAASATYLLNDMLDLEADRRHPRKRRRPFAAGDLPLLAGFAGVPALIAAAFSIAATFLTSFFLASLAVYIVTTCLYSIWLKRISTVDVMTLAGLYSLRVVGGAAAIGVQPSFWLLAFSMFLFLSLAYVKRYTELAAIAGDGGLRIGGRGYSSADAESTFILGSNAGVMAVLVMALYINSPEVRLHYGAPELLWGLCLALLYWVNRIWIGARRGRIHDDPVVFALTDRVSVATGVICVLIILLARVLTFGEATS